ncbi:MAG TPA: GIY-YIG nuclease family protein [Kiritimatiellia bacterium]|nr:GIY-YIG nuclease family protein [Kiritimatiellia bacterium]
MNFAYTYVLKCADGNMYIGSTTDLKRRLEEHHNGACTHTSGRRPLELVYYEACRSVDAARQREDYHGKTAG